MENCKPSIFKIEKRLQLPYGTGTRTVTQCPFLNALAVGANQLGRFSMETVISSLVNVKKSSVSRMQRCMYSQILFYVLER